MRCGMTFFLSCRHSTTIETRLVHRAKHVLASHIGMKGILLAMKYHIRQIEGTTVVALRMPEVGPTSTALHICIASITKTNQKWRRYRFGMDKVDVRVRVIVGVLHYIRHHTGTTVQRQLCNLVTSS